MFKTLKQFFSSNSRLLLILVSLFVIWRASLLALGLISDHFLPYSPSFPYSGDLLSKFGLPRTLYSWAGFDGVHYLTIAQKGYIGTGLVQAFFPVFPFVLLYLPNLALGGFNLLSTGLFLTNFFGLLLFILWYFFVKQESGAEVAKWSLLTLFLFPTALFFGAFYTESLFLCLVVACFWLAKRGHWYLVSLTIVFASATRIVGILLLPAMILELMMQEHASQLVSKPRIGLKYLVSLILKPNVIKNILVLSLGSLGLIGYMLFLWLEFRDPLYFAHVQSAFNSGRQNSLVIYPQVLWRSLKILATIPFDLRFITSLLEFLVGGVGLIMMIVMARTTRWSYTLFALSAFFVPTLTGTFSSLPRYFLISIPFFLGLGKYFAKHPRSGALYISISTLWLIFNTILFLQGYWVA